MVTYLVGTCHVDLKGPQRLRKFLNFVRPSSICHEGSEETAKQLFEGRTTVIPNHPAEHIDRGLLNKIIKHDLQMDGEEFLKHAK